MKLSDSHGQTIDFVIPSGYKRLGVNCSGGADSALVLYMTCAYLKENNMTDVEVNVMTCANDKKHRWNVRKAADVINYTIDRLDFDQINTHYSYYRDVQDSEYFREIERELFKDQRIDLAVSGITATPKVDAVVQDSRGEMIDLRSHPDCLTPRDPNVQRPEFVGKFYTPYTNVDKRFVADMYKHYGIDDLLDLTRSCEALPKDKFDPNFENEPCGHCWWCLERKWAFGRF